MTDAQTQTETPMVSRFDVASLGKVERTSQGFMRARGFLTRVGVLEYRRADGTVVRELRSPDEVFSAESLATLSGAPVTDLHPTTMVSPSNVRELAIGTVSDAVKPSGDFVEATITIQHADAIAAVEKGERRELSCGYQCRIDPTPGTYKGQRYDQRQLGVVYNHVALLPRGAGRAGRDVALRLDAGDAITADLLDAPPPGPELGGVVERLDAAERERDELRSRCDDLEPERDAALGRCDALERELGVARAALGDAQSPRAFNAAVHARAELLRKAERVLGDHHSFDGMSTRDVHLEVLKRLEPRTDHAGADDSYVSGRFDALIAGHLGRNDALDQAQRITSPCARIVSERGDEKPYIPPWRRPLSISKDRQNGDDR